MPWILIDSVRHDDASLELYGKDGKFMVRANGLELMNGFSHESERALGELAASFAPAWKPRILVGGLGLGYTTAALVRAVGDLGTITVAELSPAVIDWFHRHVKAWVLPETCDSLMIVQSDVAKLIAAKDRFDVVVLDVDNGPEALVIATNDALYSTTGLRTLFACLSANGVALLWSGFKSDVFESRAREAGFVVACEPFARGRTELSHFIYVLSKAAA
jgi:spermidine synthase